MLKYLQLFVLMAVSERSFFNRSIIAKGEAMPTATLNDQGRERRGCKEKTSSSSVGWEYHRSHQNSDFDDSIAKLSSSQAVKLITE
jgi:hypothetical protein